MVLGKKIIEIQLKRGKNERAGHYLSLWICVEICWNYKQDL